MSSQRKAVAIAAALLLLVLLPLGVAVTGGWAPIVDLVDAVGAAAVVPGQGAWVDLLRVLTAPGLVLVRAVILVPVVIWLLVGRRWPEVAFVIIAGLGISLVNRALKAIFDRDRPAYHDTIAEGGQSFPSGHSSGAAALAAVLVLVVGPLLTIAWRRLLTAAAAIGALTVAYTRLALGVHYLSDVLAGLALGVAWVLLIAVAFNILPKPPGQSRVRPTEPVAR